MEEVPGLAVSLLERLDRLAPRYGPERKAIGDVWSEIERAAEGSSSAARMGTGCG